jgi:hypothetical protein
MGLRGRRARTMIGSRGLAVVALALSIGLAACGSAAPSASPSPSLGVAEVSATPATATPSATSTTASPRPSRKPSTSPTHSPAKPAVATNGCYPLSDEGTCYEPGEYCRGSDAGMTGRAGDGETIVCENNDGLRWEPKDKASTPPTRPPTSSPPTSQSCYPISDEGTCYEPGEYCRDDDHGMTGRAGDGETITCEDNDGWRWEPS